MQRTGTILIVLVSAVLIASTKVRAHDPSDMARCAELDNAESRLTCYDEVMGRSSSSHAGPESTGNDAAGDISTDEPEPLTEDVGKPETDSTFVRGRVTDCQKDINDKWYFVFDNGQVWKQRSNSRLRIPECDFWVTITEDTFGYKMQIEGEDKQIRIGRVR